MNPVNNILKWEEEDDKYMMGHCEECSKKKTNKYVDLCYKCAKAKAASMGYKLTLKEYNESRG